MRLHFIFGQENKTLAAYMASTAEMFSANFEVTIYDSKNLEKQKQNQLDAQTLKPEFLVFVTEKQTEEKLLADFWKSKRSPRAFASGHALSSSIEMTNRLLRVALQSSEGAKNLENSLCEPALQTGVLHKRTISNNSEKRSALESLRGDLSLLHKKLLEKLDRKETKIEKFEIPALRHILEVADELIINGIFHANPALNGRIQGGGYLLLPHQSVTLSWQTQIKDIDGSPKAFVVLSIRDPFGTLKLTDIERHLNVTKDGASLQDGIKKTGLGLRLTRERSQMLEFRVRKGHSTQILAHLEITPNYRKTFENDAMVVVSFDSEGGNS